MADFILANVEPILVEWEAFARRLWPGVATDPFTLRDHAEDILRETARDMQSPQSAQAQAQKSQGDDDRANEDGPVKAASELHAFARVRSGFDLQGVVAEYRALRATVIRLWRESLPGTDLHDLDDLTRFNEAIDQSLTEASASYTRMVDRARHMFLAILGHDLRNPLSSVVMSAAALPRIGKLDARASEVVAQISSSADAMNRMISDLLDFTGAGLGAAMPLSLAPTDFGQTCADVVAEMRAANPGRTVNLTTVGDLSGEWDGARLRQVVSNLLGNAIQHGAASGPVDVVARLEGSCVRFAVHNGGDAIPPAIIGSIFEPLVSGASPELQKHRRPGSIGLGLYIAKEIAVAHGGTIGVRSNARDGTTFTVLLPVLAPAAVASAV